MWINDYEAAPEDLTPKLHVIFENRYVRRAYVVADSDVSYGSFADFLSRIALVKPKLDYVLLSGDLRREADHEPTFEGLCDISSPEGKKWTPFTVYVPNAPKK